MNKKLKTKISNFFFVLVRPEFYMPLYKSCYEHDKWLNDMMDKKYPVTDIGPHTCVIAGTEIWISSYPYAFGSKSFGIKDSLPYPKTRKRFAKYVESYGGVVKGR